MERVRLRRRHVSPGAAGRTRTLLIPVRSQASRVQSQESTQPGRKLSMATAKVGSIELYYEVHGSGEPLLLIMGLGADSRAWLFQLPEFSKHYRTIIFDNRGVGSSSKPPAPYTIHEMADDAAGLLD